MVKNNITDQIKNYRIDEEHKQSLLDKVKDFDKLYVQEKILNANHVRRCARARAKSGKYYAYRRRRTAY